MTFFISLSLSRDVHSSLNITFQGVILQISPPFLVFQYALFYDCTMTDVADLLKNHRSLSLSSPLIHPTLDQAEDLLNNPENYKRLFKKGYVTGYFNRLPKRITKENFRHLIRNHFVLFTMETPTRISAASFYATSMVGYGTRCITVHYYHVDQNADTLLSHTITHLNHALKVMPPGVKTGVHIYSQLGVDIDKVKEFFHGQLGIRKSTGMYSYDTAIMGGEWLGSSHL